VHFDRTLCASVHAQDLYTDAVEQRLELRLRIPVNVTARIGAT